MQNGNNRNAIFGQLSQIAEQCTAVGEALYCVIDQVAARTFDQVNKRQFLL